MHPSWRAIRMRCVTMITPAALLLLVASSHATPIPGGFDSTGEERRAIETLLNTYTTAVSTKNQALFETLLLNRKISFSGVPTVNQALAADGATQNYERFRKGVFEGAPFQQRFENVHIQQDGPLAQVSVVFVNSDAQGSTWGWKTMQLLKITGHWKIASEFYTGHG